MSAQTGFTVDTAGPGLYEITPRIARWLSGQGGDGVLTLFVRHTSCSLLVQENADSDVQADLRAFFDRLVPPADDARMHYLRHRAEGPDDMPAHIKAAMMPVSLSIPVDAGRMCLGTWQGVYVVEHRAAPHSRRIAAHLARG
jgi:secondary thiamine-phosphate synthase enzyme